MTVQKLSENLSLNEMIRTSTGYSNYPNEGEVQKLYYMAQFQFQPLRNKFGKIIVTSGFRNVVVNRAVGGSSKSQHAKAEATDFIPEDSDFQSVYDWILKNLIFGQVIWEKKNDKEWIHLSMPRLKGQNQMALTYDGDSYKPYV